MDSAFTPIAFADRARAQQNLAAIADRLPDALWKALPALLLPVPDPDGALNYLERFLRDVPSDVLAHMKRHPVALHYLLVLFSYSRFLSETLVQQPVLLLWLHRPVQRDGLERLKSHEDLNEEFARFEATSFDLPPALVLARFKRREYLRITLRDVLGLSTLADNCLELSTLADVLLARALRISEQRLQNLFGTPQFTDDAGRLQPAALTILSMGKLGAQELNYSSDIDLMFLYSRDGETSGGTSGVTTNTEYFVRLAQMILKFVTEPTPEGAVFRVDLRLRPQGSEGDVAISLPSALDYYRRQGRHWELQALIKARCSAGDPAAAATLLSELRPLIYPPEPDPAALESVLAVREEISRELHRAPGELTRDAGHAAAWNVKLSPGGIRDIEFLVQCLARLYGGADPWLQTPSTLVGLQRLHDKDYITSRDFFRLGSAYEFLRRVEHRLQLRDGLQRHTLPEAPDALDRLARRCDVEAPAHTSPGEELKSCIQRHFADVQEIYQRIILSQRPKLALARAQERRDAAAQDASPRPERSEGDSLFPQLRRIRDDYPQLAAALSHIFPAADPTARRGLTRFLSSILTRPDAARRLADSPGSLEKLAALFSHSEYAVEMLCRHPEEFVLIDDPRSHLAPQGLTEAPDAAALRIAYRTQSFAALALFALERPDTQSPLPAFRHLALLSDLADHALRGALQIAAKDIPGLPADMDHAPFVILALGRLGTQEMDFGSDADLLFVADESLSPHDREPWRRLAEQLIDIVSSQTREGILFPVDARLRPRGAEGDLVQPASYLTEYLHREAQGWEAAAFTKARPVAGNLAFGRQLVTRVRSTLVERYRGENGRAHLAEELAHTRGRMETEGLPASEPGARGGTADYKSITGGYYDVDYTLAYLRITSNALSGDPSRPGQVIEKISAFTGAPAKLLTVLRDAALFYRSVDHASRVFSGRPLTVAASPFVTIPRAAELMRLLRQWGVAGDTPLESQLVETRRRVREVYEHVVLSQARTGTERQRKSEA